MPEEHRYYGAGDQQERLDAHEHPTGNHRQGVLDGGQGHVQDHQHHQGHPQAYRKGVFGEIRPLGELE